MEIKRILLASVVLLFSTSSFAMFWSDPEPTRVMQEQKSVQQIVIDKREARCKEKLEKYDRLLRENPNNLYWKGWQNYWENKCNGGSEEPPSNR